MSSRFANALYQRYKLSRNHLTILCH
jgi:hypothetical protein